MVGNDFWQLRDWYHGEHLRRLFIVIILYSCSFFFLWALLPALFCTFPFSFLADLIPPLNYFIECLPYAEHYSAAAAAKSLQSCPTLCDPIHSSPPGSSVPGILQAGILEWPAISLPNACMHAKSLQSCPTLCEIFILNGLYLKCSWNTNDDKNLLLLYKSL